MKRILHVVSVLELGGTEAFIMNNYRVLDRTEYQFDFLVFQEREYPYAKEISSLGGHIYFAFIPSLKNMRAFTKKFRQIVNEHGPYDAVHCHVNLRNAFPLKAASLCGIPIRISHAHATYLGKTKGLKSFGTALKRKIIQKYATAYLACSEAAGEELYGKSFFQAHGAVVPNGIPVERFLKDYAKECEALRKEWKIPKDCPLIVGNITRFDRNKNGLFTIRVFSEILHAVPGAILVMGGPDAGLLEECKKLVQELGIQGSVRFIGARSDICPCIQLIDLYLFPSFTEGLGIALLEAQAGGCFCAAANSVSRNADVGLGSVLFIDLKKDASVWAAEILAAYRAWKPADQDEILRKFEAAGFEVREAHKRLTANYE